MGCKNSTLNTSNNNNNNNNNNYNSSAQNHDNIQTNICQNNDDIINHQIVTSNNNNNNNITTSNNNNILSMPTSSSLSNSIPSITTTATTLGKLNTVKTSSLHVNQNDKYNSKKTFTSNRNKNDNDDNNTTTSILQQPHTTTSPILHNIDYKTKYILSHTSLSTVYKVKWNGTPIVMKTHSKNSQLQNELKFFKRIRHPNIITFLGLSIEKMSSNSNVLKNNVNKYICLEYLNGGTLYDRLNNKKLPDLDFYGQTLKISIDILQAITYLHNYFYHDNIINNDTTTNNNRDNNNNNSSSSSSNDNQQRRVKKNNIIIIHGDIKSPNIMLDHTHHHGKLIDFTHSFEWDRSKDKMKNDIWSTTTATSSTTTTKKSTLATMIANPNVVLPPAATNNGDSNHHHMLPPMNDKEKEEFSLYWTCPERFKQNKVFTGNELMRCDIFSVGIVFWEMLTRRLPFSEQTYHDPRVVPYKYKIGERPEMPSSNSTKSPQFFIDLIQKSIDKTINKRPLALDMLTKLQTKYDLHILKEKVQQKQKQRVHSSGSTGSSTSSLEDTNKLLYSNSSLEDIKLNLQSAHANNINNSSCIIANVLHTTNYNNNNVETKETFNGTTNNNVMGISNNSIINSNSGVSSSSSSSSMSSGSNSRNNSNNNMPHVANTIQQPSPSSIVVPVTIAQASSSSVVEIQVVDNILTRQTPEREIPTKVYKETSDITVLVIDDSAFHRLALRHVLEVCGYVVKCCSSANDALQELLENQYKYDLIMCDKNMPGVNGIEFIQQVKSNILLLHIPIILVSVVEELNDINKAMELGADDYLIKPVKKNMVQTLILKLQQWQKNRKATNMWLRNNNTETKLAQPLSQNHQIQQNDNNYSINTSSSILTSAATRSSSSSYLINSSDNNISNNNDNNNNNSTDQESQLSLPYDTKVKKNNIKPLERWEIPVLKKKQILSSGHACTTYKCKVRGMKVAIKCYRRTHTEKSERELALMQKEIELMQSLVHPNVVEIVGVVATQNEVWLVSKYMKYGCLRDILSNDKIQLSFKLKIKIAKDIANGLKYLHNKEPVVVHRDLKTANIIIGYKKRAKKKVDDHPHKHIFKNLQLQRFMKKKLNDGNDDEEEDSNKDDSSSSSSSCSSDDDDDDEQGNNSSNKTETQKINSNELLTEYLRKNINTSIENLSVRLCDFGLSSTLEKSFLLSTRCGSPAWIAPEVMVGRFYDQRIDIYAFGLVMWEIMERGVPFSEDTTSIIDLMTKVCEHKLRPTFKDNIIFETDAEKQNDDGSDTTMSDKIRSIMYSQYCELAKACWSHDQNMRPSIDYILKVLTEIEDELNVMSKNNNNNNNNDKKKKNVDDGNTTTSSGDGGHTTVLKERSVSFGSTLF